MFDTNTLSRDELEEELIALASCIPNVVSNPASLSEARIRAARILGLETVSEMGATDGQFVRIVDGGRLKPSVWTESDIEYFLGG